jgi:hypothetical protein
VFVTLVCVWCVCYACVRVVCLLRLCARGVCVCLRSCVFALYLIGPLKIVHKLLSDVHACVNL